ncbi:MarR family winged helix-turn-helix transcriptional regulator [Crassaminicella profunda]|uniref:MarR family winged helix-turn-helix transcriptional regulator n=1 Tax=Crassaminicella profunda TaxID=1286698 RepID=UPI001CA6FB30|nr:MarR family transcriptional regulator [Crassaminicella profunda]QZY53859.1 MarR family transcriptional regulator [Crassaminicella profunda]
MNLIKLNNYILREIGALSRTIHTIVEIKFKELNLQKGQFIYITRICEHPGINLIQLSSLLKVDKTTTTKVIQKLLKEDFILKKKNNDDKRSYQLYPTSKTLKIYEEIIKEENRNIEICFRDFDDDQKKSVLELIKKMKKNLETDWYQLKNYKE